MTLIGFFPGSFDPPTKGHVDVISRAAQLCERLIVGVMRNPSKEQELFSLSERVDLLNQLLQGPEVVAFEGLAVDAAQRVHANCLIRGIRSATDCEYEFRMAVANRKVSGLETLFLMTDERYSHISSTLIRELGAGGRELSAFLPDTIEAQVKQRL